MMRIQEFIEEFLLPLWYTDSAEFYLKRAVPSLADVCRLLVFLVCLFIIINAYCIMYIPGAT